MTAASDDRPVAALLAALAADGTKLVRQEVALTRAQLVRGTIAVKAGVILTGIGAAILLLAAAALSAGAILALARWLEPWQAAVAVGAVLLVIGGVLAALGSRRLSVRRPG
jgi:hypothetical protein